MTSTAPISAEAFAQMTFAENEGFELVEGELSPLCSATPGHNFIKDLLVSFLLAFFRQSPCGRSVSETDCRLSPETVLRPDISVFLNPRAAEIDLDSVPVPFAPDIVIEILSPSEGAIQVNRKLRHYLAAGTQEVWLIDISNAEIFIHTPASIRRVEGNAPLETPLLPGFHSSVSQLLATL